ncbi:MAG: pilus assembly PilX N-terminal domain-containing protein [Alteromonadaceae bacterium]|nr:pilus assembly PilX N-terminal domain-containing protein [Alteromonadaceae bacterium]
MVMLLKGNIKSKQQGVVLVISLVFLIALTAVAAALMLNTTTDMRMSGASQEKVIATQEAVSAIDEIIYNEVKKVNTVEGVNNNAFTSALVTFPKTPTVSGNNTTATISSTNPYQLEADCPHVKAASSVQVFKCNVLRVQVTRNYGRTNNSTIQVNSGIAQELLNVGN